jgi:hypothetical protein
VTLSNIEPLARAIAERACRRHEISNRSNSPMTAEEVAAWVDSHWQCAAADLEAGVLDDTGNTIPGANWELGLAAYCERTYVRKQ